MATYIHYYHASKFKQNISAQSGFLGPAASKWMWFAMFSRPPKIWFCEEINQPEIIPSKNEMSILTQFSPSAHLVHI